MYHEKLIVPIHFVEINEPMRDTECHDNSRSFHVRIAECGSLRKWFCILLIAAIWQPLLFTKPGHICRARARARDTRTQVITELTYVYV